MRPAIANDYRAACGRTAHSRSLYGSMDELSQNIEKRGENIDLKKQTANDTIAELWIRRMQNEFSEGFFLGYGDRLFSN